MRKKRRYGQRSGNPRGTPEDTACCITRVWRGYLGMMEGQCARKRGHGTGGLYCKQHAKMEERET